MTMDNTQYIKEIEKKMRRWSPERLDKEDVMSKGDECGWEGEQWRLAIDREKIRRQGLTSTPNVVN